MHAGLPFGRRYGSETHGHLGVHPPEIRPSCVGPAGVRAGLEPAEATVDAVEVAGVVEVVGGLACSVVWGAGVADASWVTVEADDGAEWCTVR